MGNNDSRTIFREHIQQLVNEDLSTTSDFWTSLFTLESSMQDVFQMVSEEDIQRLVTDYKQNFIKLLEHCFTYIQESISTILNLDAQQILFTSNSVKILTRVIPSSYKSREFYNLWWESNRMPMLIKSIVDLMHTQLYTVSASLTIKKSDGIVLALLWKEGLLLKNPTVEAGEVMWLRRYELLLLLKAVLADVYPNMQVSPSAHFLVSQNFVLQAVYSVINTLITFNAKGVWNLPYSSYVNTFNKEKCLKTGLQIVCLLNYCKPVQPCNCLVSNVKGVIKGLKSREDLFLVWNAVQGLFASSMVAANTYLPGSQKAFKLNEEILMFILTMINENEGFIHVMISQESSVKIIPWILSVLLTAQNQTVSLCAYVLIKLSEHRKFCLYLNTQLASCPLDLPLFTGCYADMIILAISKLIINKSINQHSALLLLLTFVCNFSPYCKEICPQASHGLIKVLQDLSQNYTTEESSSEALGLHLEILSNLVQYQWRGSFYIVYWLLQNAGIVYRLEKVAVERIQAYVQTCVVVVQGLKELRSLGVAQFVEVMKGTTLVGMLPQPHQILTRKINFEDGKMMSFVFQMFFMNEGGVVIYE